VSSPAHDVKLASSMPTPLPPAPLSKLQLMPHLGHADPQKMIKSVECPPIEEVESPPSAVASIRTHIDRKVVDDDDEDNIPPAKIFEECKGDDDGGGKMPVAGGDLVDTNSNNEADPDAKDEDNDDVDDDDKEDDNGEDNGEDDGNST